MYGETSSWDGATRGWGSGMQGNTGCMGSAQPRGDAPSCTGSTGLPSLPAITVLQLLSTRHSHCQRPQQGDVVRAAVDGCLVGTGVDLLWPERGEGVGRIAHDVRLELHQDLQGGLQLLLAAGRGEGWALLLASCVSMLGAAGPCSPVNGEEDRQAVVPQQQQGGQPARQQVWTGMETCGDTAVRVPLPSWPTPALGKGSSNSHPLRPGDPRGVWVMLAIGFGSKVGPISPPPWGQSRPWALG